MRRRSRPWTAKRTCFFANFLGLRAKENAVQTPEKHAEIIVPGKVRGHFLPFLGEETTITVVSKTGARTSICRRSPRVQWPGLSLPGHKDAVSVHSRKPSQDRAGLCCDLDFVDNGDIPVNIYRFDFLTGRHSGVDQLAGAPQATP